MDIAYTAVSPKAGSTDGVVAHPCALSSVSSVQLMVGQSRRVRLCVSPVASDGIAVITYSSFSRLLLWEETNHRVKQFLYLPQEARHQYNFAMKRTLKNTEDSGPAAGSVEWEAAPFDMLPMQAHANRTVGGRNVLADPSACQLHLYLNHNATTATTAEAPKDHFALFGKFGGVCFLVWLVLRMVTDCHYRCTHKRESYLVLQDPEMAGLEGEGGRGGGGGGVGSGAVGLKPRAAPAPFGPSSASSTCETTAAVTTTQFSENLVN